MVGKQRGFPHSKAGQREKSEVFRVGRPEPFTHLRSPPRGWGCPSSLLLPPQTSLSEREAPSPEVPINLLTQGTLRSDPAGEQPLS